MSGESEQTDKTEALREHISTLSAAVLRINASLDIATILREALDTARTLTGARYGIITTIDETGEVRDCVSSGLTEEEYRQFLEWPDRPKFLAYLRDLPGPMRIADLPALVHSLELSPDHLVCPDTFQGTPLHHRGETVGHFFLAGKEGAPAFTDEDEEVLVLFASQAATAINNARTYRDEKRARADLEALIQTSPVGVVVFDAPSGQPVSCNSEAKRIVEGLRSAGRPLEELLDVVTVRRSNGDEVFLSEFPLAQQLGTCETVRAEEIVLSVPDGRSVSMLVNVTPIRAEDGTVMSVVVSMQDLAPLQELERLRAEFLGMVRRELRTPLVAIKGSAATLLEEGAELESAEMHEFFHIIHEQAGHMRSLIGALLDVGRIEAGILSISPEPSETAVLVDQARNRFLTSGSRHTVLVDVPHDLPRVMADRQRVVQVLNNLFSNAARHSPESAPIRVTATRDGVHVAVAIADEGHGIAPEQLPRLFQKYGGAGDGGSRAIAKTGLGLIICKGLVEAHGGRIRAESDGPGQGSLFTFTLPVIEDTRDVVPVVDRTPAPVRTERKPERILIVEDDPNTLRYVRDILTGAGYAPVMTGGHEDLARIIRAEKPVLVLLDLMLPGTDSIALMETVPELSGLPVVFISGYGRDETIAKALEAGATDYIVKPFSPTELCARVRAALRSISRPEPFQLDGLAIHYEERRITIDGREVTLTATEYKILHVLSLNAGRVVTYEALERQVWEGRKEGDLNLMRNFIKKLRAKLGEDAANPTWIFNLRGVGYRMPRPDGRS